MTKLRVLDLFSGIGGFSLGLERTGGFETVAFCEIEDYPRRVLAKHWPKVPIYHDVRTLTADALSRDGISVDVICGGFPCQDISGAGKGAGLAGERSGLWREYARIIGELRPSLIIVENVAMLLSRGLGDVLGDMAALGYDAEWHCIPASAIGAPHERDRVWVLANASRRRCSGSGEGEVQLAGRNEIVGAGEDVADATGERRAETRQLRFGQPQEWSGRRRAEMANAVRKGLAHGGQAGEQTGAVAYQWRMALAELERRGRAWWASEPGMDRVADGVPNRVDRIAALGNAVVPQIPELIGRAILAARLEAQKEAA